MRAPIPVLLAAVLVGGCKTPIVWDGGLPPSGRRLTNDRRVEEYGKFIPSRFAGDRVFVRRGKDEVAYSLSSYSPVMNTLDPTIEAKVIEAQRFEAWGFPLLYVATAAAGYAAQTSIDDRHRYGALGVAALAFGAGKYVSWEAASAWAEGMRRLRGALDKRLFP